MLQQVIAQLMQGLRQWLCQGEQLGQSSGFSSLRDGRDIIIAMPEVLVALFEFDGRNERFLLLRLSAFDYEDCYASDLLEPLHDPVFDLTDFDSLPANLDLRVSSAHMNEGPISLLANKVA
jgi:hypothetical protein